MSRQFIRSAQRILDRQDELWALRQETSKYGGRAYHGEDVYGGINHFSTDFSTQKISRTRFERLRDRDYILNRSNKFNRTPLRLDNLRRVEDNLARRWGESPHHFQQVPNIRSKYSKF